MVTLASSTAVVLYTDSFEEEDSRLYIQRSTDSGATWQAPQYVGDDGLYGAIAGAGTDVDVVWSDDDSAPGVIALRYRHSSDSGTTFEAPLEIATGVYTVDFYAPNIARRGDIVAIVWADGQPNRIRARVSTNGGASFGPVTDLGPTTRYAAWPVIAVGNGVIYAAYLADETHVNMRRSLDSGATWTPAVELASDADSGWLTALSLTASARHAYLAYAAESGASKWIRYRRTVDQGASWTAVADLSSSSGNGTRRPLIDLNSGVVRVVYAECLIASCNRSVVKYRESSDGVTWTLAETASLNSTRWAYPVGVGFAGQVVVVYAAQHGRDPYDCSCDLYVSTK